MTRLISCHSSPIIRDMFSEESIQRARASGVLRASSNHRRRLDCKGKQSGLLGADTSNLSCDSGEKRINTSRVIRKSI